MGEIIVWPKAATPLPFTGERLTSAYAGQTEIEHLHRYLLAREWCRGKDVLDVASGEGYGTALLAQVARKAVGVEIAREAVEHASGAYKADNLSFIAGDARALPCPEASFDVVTSFETIEHFAEQELFLSEIRRVLRPDGLLIVSTPDRDNYSPAESPANPFHVKELTGAEFDMLLRSSFAEVSVLLQRPMFGSVLFPNGGAKAPPSCFERRGDGHFEGSFNLPRPQYIVAFASDHPIPPLPPSVYIDTGRLGMLRPPEAEAQLWLLRNEVRNNKAGELESLRTELSASREERMGLLAAKEMAERACASAREEATSSREEATSAREEAKGLLAANEMAERACALTRQELGSALEEAKGLLAANEMAERACAVTRQELGSALEEVKGLKAAYEMAERACALARGQLTECQERVNILSQERTKLSERVQRPWLKRVARELRRFGRRLHRKS